MNSTINSTSPPITLEDLDTPAVVVDLDVVDANVNRLFSRFSKNRVGIRPHLKTVKSPRFAKMLLEAGAIGVCVAKLSEAEVMASAGISGILITTELIGTQKMRRLEKLLEIASDLTVVVDSEYGASQLQETAQRGGKKLNVLIEINVGQNRAGVEPGSGVVALASFLEKQPNLVLRGVQGYEGHLQLLTSNEERVEKNRESMEVLSSVVSDLRDNGIEIQIVTTGGTGTGALCASSETVTEIQPGSFIFMDRAYRTAIGEEYEFALSVMATVISKPTKHRAIVDAGLKSLSNDSGDALLLHPSGHTYRHAGDEHGVIESLEGEVKLEIGDRVHLIPSHIDTTVNLHDVFYCHRNGRGIEPWEIAARGKVQ